MANEERPRGQTPADQRTWIDDPRNIDRIVNALYGLCALLLVVDIFVSKHGPFDLEHWWGFYAFYGFIACAAFVLAAMALRMIIKKPENYYDDE